MDNAHLNLKQKKDGDREKSGELLAQVYEQLRRLARQKMALEKAGQTLQPTALVHEVWLRVEGGGEGGPRWDGKGHFLAAAAEAMRRILVERARKRLTLKRGSGVEPVEFEAIEVPVPDTDENLLLVHELLEEFGKEHPQKAELVKLRYFAGLRFEETAGALGIAVPTAKASESEYHHAASPGLARTIDRHARAAGDHMTAFPALSLHRRDAPTEPISCVYGLGLAVTTQGGKQVMLGDKALNYSPGQSMLPPISNNK
jgi:RNA polymerase sigma factor (TIGR02999 family)